MQRESAIGINDKSECASISASGRDSLARAAVQKAKGAMQEGRRGTRNLPRAGQGTEEQSLQRRKGRDAGNYTECVEALADSDRELIVLDVKRPVVSIVVGAYHPACRIQQGGKCVCTLHPPSNSSVNMCIGVEGENHTFCCQGQCLWRTPARA